LQDFGYHRIRISSINDAAGRPAPAAVPTASVVGQSSGAAAGPARIALADSPADLLGHLSVLLVTIFIGNLLAVLIGDFVAPLLGHVVALLLGNVVAVLNKEKLLI